MEEVTQGLPSVILFQVPFPPSEELVFPSSYSMLQNAVRFVLWEALIVVNICSLREPDIYYRVATGAPKPGSYEYFIMDAWAATSRLPVQSR